MPKDKKTNKTQTIMVFVSAICVLLLGIFLKNNVQSIQQNPFIHIPRMPWEDLLNGYGSRIKRIEMANRRFDLPTIYFNTKPDKGEHQDDILLEVIWPDISNNNNLPTSEGHRKAFKEGKLGWILIDTASRRPSLDIQVSYRRRGLTEEEIKGKKGKLEKFIWYHGRQNPSLAETIFIEKDASGKILTFIECHENVPFPGCNQRFIDGGLLYDVSYRMKDFFPEWQLQRERTITFMKNFEVNSKR